VLVVDHGLTRTLDVEAAIAESGVRPDFILPTTWAIARGRWRAGRARIGQFVRGRARDDGTPDHATWRVGTDDAGRGPREIVEKVLTKRQAAAIVWAKFPKRRVLVNRSILATTSLAALVALSACSSNDDEETPDGAIDTSGQGETSELSSDMDVPSTPGGDTSAIAGYWDASDTGPESTPMSRFVLFTDDGLETSYERQIVDGTTDDVCYSQAGPQTLTPNGDDVYTPADGSDTFTAVRVEGEDTLTVTTPDFTQVWTLEADSSPEDLTLCLDTEADVAPDRGENVLPGDDAETDPEGTSSFNPDLAPPAPDQNPSGDDTGAIAGLWDASFGDGALSEERYVEISEDGLWIDYSLDLDEGNCFVATPLRLDLETTEGDSSTYSIGDGRTFAAAPPSDDDTLTLTFDGVGGDSWPLVTGRVADDLPLCDAG